VHIKRVELSHFKSFGGTAQVPLLPGFTVISGPNGSGKSNILDALLFCLGLSGSKGMRAERLPDLVNQSVATRGRSTIEASVTVTFALDEDDLAAYVGDNESPPASSSTPTNGNGHPATRAADELGQTNGNGKAIQGEQLIVAPTLVPFNEWNVTRKLRVTQQGTYTSTYFINGQSCTLTDLHEQLNRFRVYPEGYNVVLQGDVTSIISMNSRERREIIDELAGVAAFDRKIHQAKDKLDAVKEHEEKFRIVERELITQLERLAQDRVKAEKYQRLRAEFQAKTQWEAVLAWQAQVQQVEQVVAQLAAGDRSLTDLAQQLEALQGQIRTSEAMLEQMNMRVKALGEDEQLALQSTLATREAELRQMRRQAHELDTQRQQADAAIQQHQQEIQQATQELAEVERAIAHLTTHDLVTLRRQCDAAQQTLHHSRAQADEIAAASDAWVQEQAALRRQIEALQQQVEPQRTEQARLQERATQLQQKIQEQTDALGAIAQSLQAQAADRDAVQAQHDQAVTQVQQLAGAIATAEQDLSLQQETQTRLLAEQRDRQRQLDKLEAQAQATQEAQGTGAAQAILTMGLSGVCGLVAQLGRVDAQYQRALELSAGGRLGNIVVEDDGVAAAAIALLKQRKAGRATFLPLTKIRPSSFKPLPAWNRPEGFIDYAVNLIDCDDRYREVFAYVFGGTAVFADLATARPYLGKFRIVTLDGELLETSGAMTGGSLSPQRGSLRFGTVAPSESAEAEALRDRLQELDRILGRCDGAIAQASVTLKDQTDRLTQARQQQREAELLLGQLQTQQATLVAQEGQTRTQLSQHRQELGTAQTRLQQLDGELPGLDAELQQQRHTLAELEASQTHSEWQQMQAAIRQQESVVGDRQQAVRAAEQRLQDLETQRQRLQERLTQQQQRLQEQRRQQTAQLNQQTALRQQQDSLQQQILALQSDLAALEQQLKAAKDERNATERQLREQQLLQQQTEWQRNKLQETQQERRTAHTTLDAEVAAKRAELPDPLPDLPDDAPDLTTLQNQLRSLQKRMQAMEPVNMLALEEHKRTQTRLDELSQKLGTLEEERTELLLRIENFTTLRQRAFKEAFDAVNQNFQSIFAELSDGDGYLQIDNMEDPFASGLNLVAHPKGKPVRRLASMSGGEKSLTALSFIFALQRYRPSPFYAFDEVDMFLDGANVERLAKMIKQQAQQAQFIVVSLRRPMIESAQRTIGVTQARGAFTQVLGIDLESQTATR
jgi:chromosome segregation protein